MQLIIQIILTLFNVIDAGIETQELNETENLKETIEAEAVEAGTRISDVPDDVSSECPATEPTSSNGQGTTDGEGEMQRLGRKRREQFSETLVGHRNKKLKKKIPADAQLVQFTEKELKLKGSMFERLETIKEDQTKTISTLTSQLQELTSAMTGTMMLLQQTMQRPNPFPYQQYGSQYVPPPSPRMRPDYHYTHSTPAQRSLEEMYDSQPLFEDDN